MTLMTTWSWAYFAVLLITNWNSFSEIWISPINFDLKNGNSFTLGVETDIYLFLIYNPLIILLVHLNSN